MCFLIFSDFLWPARRIVHIDKVASEHPSGYGALFAKEITSFPVARYIKDSADRICGFRTFCC